MLKIIMSVLLCAAFSGVVFGQRCDSIAAAGYGGWKPIITAPRDGTTIEMLETYGVAPWYGLFYWLKKGTKYKMTVHVVDNDGKQSEKEEELIETIGRWAEAHNASKGVSDDACLFWRPYKGDAKKYVDPTNGAQDSTSYWCAYMHMAYNKKKDACE